LYFLAAAMAGSSARTAASALDEARKLHEAARSKTQSSHVAALNHARTTAVSRAQSLNSSWKALQAEARTLRADWTARVENKSKKLSVANEEQKRLRILGLDQSHQATLNRLTNEVNTIRKNFDIGFNENSGKLTSARDAARADAATDWQKRVL